MVEQPIRVGVQVTKGADGPSRSSTGREVEPRSDAGEGAEITRVDVLEDKIDEFVGRVGNVGARLVDVEKRLQSGGSASLCASRVVAHLWLHHLSKSRYFRHHCIQLPSLDKPAIGSSDPPLHSEMSIQRVAHALAQLQQHARLDLNALNLLNPVLPFIPCVQLWLVQRARVHADCWGRKRSKRGGWVSSSGRC